MTNFVAYAVIVFSTIVAILWAVEADSKETTSLDDAINRPTKVEKIETKYAECFLVTKHHHTYFQCVPKE